ncbi:uncharacterized protein LOC141717219 [Apium graveolens]|uniref:uncharacterized protein LOC141717219 n=1 Tax=Apium graveolens TaxID=4045 RepID=UPI003D7A9F2C
MSSQVVTCNATFLEKNISILVSFVYAHNDVIDRVPLWDYCLSLSTTTLPWCLLGDFNCVVSLAEISGGREHWTPDMQAFKDCLANCGLDNIRTVGDIFTWTNKRANSPVFKRLDRMVANGVWFNLFTEGNAFVKPRGLMDHNVILFEEPMQLQKVNKPFQFFNYMIDITGFHVAVDKAWSLPCSSSCYAQFASRLRETKLLLRQLNMSHGDVSSNILVARANLEELQACMLNNGDPSLLALEKDLINKLNLALAEEESLFLQKSRVKWMGLGDGNNAFFHQQCKANWNHNKVLALEDDSGTLVHGQLPCANLSVTYFKNLLGSEIVSSHIDLESVDCKVLTDTQTSFLSDTVTDALILDTLKKMKKNKAPGPDGVNVEFFLAAWSTTGPDLCAFIKHFFETVFLPSGTNSTLISIIPKVDSPARMSDFRPITLCTVMYKCISKIIAARLKLIMPSIIDIAQSAFIPGRSISDNILLAQELFRSYDRDTGSSKCALKNDLHKSFDSLNWDFIMAVLVRLHFPDIVIKWIKACLCTTRFSVKLNGVIHGYFQGTKGIRQGGPMFPYIFAMCMQILSSILNKVPQGFRLNSWTTLFLSLARRALLIKSVVCALEAFWCNHFMLPGAVHATIQSLLTRFLWRGNINHKSGAKVDSGSVSSLSLVKLITFTNVQIALLKVPNIDGCECVEFLTNVWLSAGEELITLGVSTCLLGHAFFGCTEIEKIKRDDKIKTETYKPEHSIQKYRVLGDVYNEEVFEKDRCEKYMREFNPFVPIIECQLNTIVGNSGSPVFNARGEVVGMVHGHSGPDSISIHVSELVDFLDDYIKRLVVDPPSKYATKVCFRIVYLIRE